MVAADKDIKDLELKKHVGSIHCSNTLSLLQRKISNVLLYHAYDELLEKEEHEIGIKTLCRLIGYSSHDYETIKKALKALISTVLEWNLLGDSKNNGGDDWNASSILSSVGIKGGVCTYSYSNRLKKLLYMPEIYGRINISIQARFNSNYALALYENCIRYKNLPYTRWFALSTFRKLMGVPEEKYIIFRDFKRRVLDKSVEEVNAFSDIVVEPQIEREGHKIQRLRFKIDHREDLISSADSVSESVCGKNGIYQHLLEFGLSQAQVKKIVAEYEESFVREKLQLIKQSTTYKLRKVQNMAAYLHCALKDDYQGQISRLESDIPKTVALEISDDIDRKDYVEFISKKIDGVMSQLEDNVKNALLMEFELYLQANNNSFVLDKYKDKGLSNRIVTSMFRTFIKENHRHLIPDYMSLEEYKNTRVENGTQ